jgi:5-formyltetrahydrofolate cyclo-ligase
MATKSSLRKLITGKLKTLNAAEIQRQSREVFERLVNHDKFREAKSISLYLSTDLEIDTIKILKYALEEGGKHCFVPFIDNQRAAKYFNTEPSTRMLMVELKSMYDYEMLPVNRFGIKEMTSLINENNERLRVASPLNCDLDLMIVPGVAFSIDGRRLGHGMGYYDEFLIDWSQRSSKCERKLYTIGLALREQIVDDPLAVAGKDVTLDEIIVSDN